MISAQAFYEKRAAQRDRELHRHYHQLIQRHYRFLIPPQSRILEIGCSSGELLHVLNPSHGVGIDFSPSIIQQAKQRFPKLEFHLGSAHAPPASGTFDYIILSDLANDLPDVQSVLQNLHQFATPHTRLILNSFNHLWRPILRLAESLGAKAPTPQQNWLSSHDLHNLLHLAGWEQIKEENRILWPIKTPILGPLLNRWIAPLLKHFCLTIFMVARPRPQTLP
ncbi:MAG: class I SAM-dependent methyltransferase, partial [Limisphaerales bacterium]